MMQRHASASGNDRTWRPVLTGALADDAHVALTDLAADLSRASRLSREQGNRRADPASAVSVSSGDSGVGIFFAYLDRLRPDARHAAEVTECLTRSADAIVELGLLPHLYSGFSGIGWAIAHLARLGVEDAREYDISVVDDELEKLLSRSPWFDHYDLISGLVGYAVYAIERLDTPSGARLAGLVVDRLAELSERSESGITWLTPARLLDPFALQSAPQGWYNCGVAHGVPGVIGVLSRCVAAEINVDTSRALLDGAVRWLLNQCGPASRGARLPYSIARGATAPGAPSRSAWCYGDPGVGAVLLSAGEACGVREWVDEGRRLLADAALRSFEDSGVVDASLCHGAAGLALIFNRAAQATHDDTLEEAAQFWYGKTLSLRHRGSGPGGFQYRAHDAHGRPYWSPDVGLLEGSAGIGLALIAGLAETEPSWDRLLLTDCRPMG